MFEEDLIEILRAIENDLYELKSDINHHLYEVKRKDYCCNNWFICDQKDYCDFGQQCMFDCQIEKNDQEILDHCEIHSND